MTELPPLTDVDLFYRDLLADAMAAVLASQWRERAERLRDARPRIGDFHGQATREALSARWQRLTALAAACDAKAELMKGADAPSVCPELETFALWGAA